MLLYLLQVNVLILLFTASYWLVLRQGKLLQLNRMILALSILLAFLLPLLPLHSFLEESVPEPVRELTARATNALPEVAPSITTSPSEDAESTSVEPSVTILPNRAWQLSVMVFFGGAALLVFLLVRQFLHIFKLILYSSNTRVDGLTLVHTDEDIPPFSFFRFLVINPTKYDEDELQRIIVHEKVHINQHHYLDILLGEMLRVLLWYNPFAWLLNGLLKMNLEYIADRRVLSAGIDRKGYQFQLLRMGVRGQSLRLTTPLNYSPIKMRITMMNTKKISPLSAFRYLLLLPVLLLSLVVISPAQAQKTQIIVGQGSANANAHTSITINQGEASNSINRSVNRSTAIDYGRNAVGRDIYFVISPSTKKKTLMDVQETLAERGITVEYQKVKYDNGRLASISVSVKKGDYFGIHVFEQLDNRIVFYDLEVADQAIGFQVGTPPEFNFKQRKIIDGLSGLYIKNADGRVSIRGSATID